MLLKSLCTDLFRTVCDVDNIGRQNYHFIIVLDGFNISGIIYAGILNFNF